MASTCDDRLFISITRPHSPWGIEIRHSFNWHGINDKKVLSLEPRDNQKRGCEGHLLDWSMCQPDSHTNQQCFLFFALFRKEESVISHYRRFRYLRLVLVLQIITVISRIPINAADVSWSWWLVGMPSRAKVEQFPDHGQMVVVLNYEESLFFQEQVSTYFHIPIRDKRGNEDEPSRFICEIRAAGSKR